MMNSPRPKVASEIWSVIWPKNCPRDAVTAGNDTCSDQKVDEAVVTMFFIDD